MKTTAILKNEKGGLAILTTVMLLVLLTVISIAASRTANIETQIATNEYAYQRCFYNAEGAIMEAVDLLDTTVNPKEILPAWMGEDSDVLNDGTVFSFWQDDAQTGKIAPQSAQVDSADSGFMAVHEGVLPGSSLAMSKPTKHSFSIYGRCEKNGLVMLSVGYANAYK